MKRKEVTMAQIDKVIPFILKWECGIAMKVGENLEEYFTRCRKRGWANDPDDKGGATMCGVTIGTYRAYCKKKGYPVPTALRLYNITWSEWRDVLKAMYWDKCLADRIESQGVANAIVDWYWNSGVYGIKNVQKVLGVVQDGIIGNKSVAAINSRSPLPLFGAIKEARIAYVNRIARNGNNKKFLAGWLNRINDLKYQ